jgi:hypothetical protein
MDVHLVEGGPSVAQTVIIAAHGDVLPIWAHVLFGFANLLAAVAAAGAVYLAAKSLRESTAVRKLAMRQATADAAQRRLEALADVAVQLHVFDEATQNNRLRDAIAARETIRVLAKANRLDEEVPSLAKVTNYEVVPSEALLSQFGGQLLGSAAIEQVHEALDDQAELVHKLTAFADESPSSRTKFLERLPRPLGRIRK